MKGIDVINFIKKNELENALVTVTATIYRNGDHDCITTDEVSIGEGSKYIGKGKYESTIDFYVDDSPY